MNTHEENGYTKSHNFDNNFLKIHSNMYQVSHL